MCSAFCACMMKHEHEHRLPRSCTHSRSVSLCYGNTLQRTESSEDWLQTKVTFSCLRETRWSSGKNASSMTAIIFSRCVLSAGRHENWWLSRPFCQTPTNVTTHRCKQSLHQSAARIVRSSAICGGDNGMPSLWQSWMLIKIQCCLLLVLRDLKCCMANQPVNILLDWFTGVSGNPILFEHSQKEKKRLKDISPFFNEGKFACSLGSDQAQADPKNNSLNKECKAVILVLLWCLTLSNEWYACLAP